MSLGDEVGGPGEVLPQTFMETLDSLTGSKRYNKGFKSGLRDDRIQPPTDGKVETVPPLY
jgi:hypothetical protein